LVRNQIVHRAHPHRAQLIERMSDPDLINPRACSHRADDDGDVISLALRVHDIGEQHCLAIVLVEPPAKLPAHQRMDFRVLVDRDVHLQEQSRLFQRRELIVQIEIGARRPRRAWSSRLGHLRHLLC
jgi:hypothetical protein